MPPGRSVEHDRIEGVSPVRVGGNVNVDRGGRSATPAFFTPPGSAARPPAGLCVLAAAERRSGGQACDHLRRRPEAYRKVIGQDIETAQYGWPLGMPLIRKLEPGLWEVRAHVAGGIALSGRNAQKAIGFREGGVQTAESSLG